MADISSIFKSVKNDSFLSSPFKQNSQKIISSFIIEEEYRNIFLALDHENYLYIWILKKEMIEFLSLIDESEEGEEERNDIIPKICFNIREFLRNNFGILQEKKIIITSLNYLQNSNKKYIKITGNFNSILISEKNFLEYIYSVHENNLNDLDRQAFITNEPIIMQIEQGEKDFKSK